MNRTLSLGLLAALAAASAWPALAQTALPAPNGESSAILRADDSSCRRLALDVRTNSEHIPNQADRPGTELPFTCFYRKSPRRRSRRGPARFMDMLATLLTLAFLAVAILAVAVISASFAKGLAAASMLRQQLALCSDIRTVTVRHERARAHPVAMARSARRPARSAPALVVVWRQREAA